MNTACTFPSSGYTDNKPNGPVRKNTTNTAFATPNDKRGFVMPKFFGVVRIAALAIWLRGVVGVIRKDARTAVFVFLTTTLHLLRVRTQTVDSLIHTGTKTMTATLRAHTAAPTSTTPRIVSGLSLTDPRCAEVLNALPGMADPAPAAPIPAERLQSVLGAYNAANLASSYIERGNFIAARRKLTLALAAINQLTAEA